MDKRIKPPISCPAIRVVMMPRDTNPEGTIFGGVLLSLIDQAAYVEAVRQAHHRYVTVLMRGVEFHEPVFVGDVLSLFGEVLEVGKTSITVRVKVTADRRRQPETTVEVTQADVVMVALGKDAKPVSVFSD